MEQNINPTRVKEQIVSNLMSAGILLSDETDKYYKQLEGLSLNELVKVLVVSHELREECTHKSMVIISPICLN